MPGGFSISPAESAGPAPVRLVMPATGYKAAAFITDPCGQPVKGAWLTVAGNVATPHGLPHGTSYVDWRITAAPGKAAATPAAGGTVSLVLASKQTVGKATTCKAARSPYGQPDPKANPGPPHQAAATAAQPAPAAHLAGWQTATGIGGYVLVAAVLAAAVVLWWRRGRPVPILTRRKGR